MQRRRGPKSAGARTGAGTLPSLDARASISSHIQTYCFLSGKRDIADPALPRLRDGTACLAMDGRGRGPPPEDLRPSELWEKWMLPLEKELRDMLRQTTGNDAVAESL